MLKNTQAKKPYGLNTLLPWLLIGAGVLLLWATVAFNIWLSNNQPPKLATREDVIKLQTIVADIKTKLEDTNGPWQDTSSCTIIEARQFGQEERYYCEVQYERTRTDIGRRGAKSIIDDSVAKAVQTSGVVGIKPGSSISYPTLISPKEGGNYGGVELLLNASFSYDQMCALEYEMTGSKGRQLHEGIRCYIETDSVYLPKVNHV